ncbi:MAG: hypothetical protein HYT87_12655 [Nitrospirae bacterium]|nr:hypothetical protein [Nitrospirota bacterium]
MRRLGMASWAVGVLLVCGHLEVWAEDEATAPSAIEKQTDLSGFVESRTNYGYGGAELPMGMRFGGYLEGATRLENSLLRLSVLGQYGNAFSEDRRTQRLDADVWYAYAQVWMGEHQLTAGRQVLNWGTTQVSLIDQVHPANSRETLIPEDFAKVPLEMVSWSYEGMEAYVSFWRPSWQPLLSESQAFVKSKAAFSTKDLLIDLNDFTRSPEFPVQMGFRADVAIPSTTVRIAPSAQVLVERIPAFELEKGLQGTPGKGFEKIDNIVEEDVGESVAATGEFPIVIRPKHYFLLGSGFEYQFWYDEKNDGYKYTLRGEAGFFSGLRLPDEDLKQNRLQIGAATVEIARRFGDFTVIDEAMYARHSKEVDLVGLDRTTWANLLAVQYTHGDNWFPRVAAIYVNSEGFALVPMLEYVVHRGVDAARKDFHTKQTSMKFRLGAVMVEGEPIRGRGAQAEIFPRLQASNMVFAWVRYEM